jgi:ABC-type glycerol-3-phosphate transport system permease component
VATVGGVDTDYQMAAATMTVLPLLIAFLFMQKRFIEGMATTGMK